MRLRKVVLLLAVASLGSTLAGCAKDFPDAEMLVPESIDPNRTTTTYGTTQSTSFDAANPQFDCLTADSPKWDFAPSAYDAYVNITPERFCELQRSLDLFGPPKTDTVNFAPIYASKPEGTKIAVDIWVRNGLNENIWDIKGRLTLKAHGSVVADGNFFFKKEDLGELPTGRSRYWTIIYDVGDVKNIDADLNDLTLESDVTFTHPIR